jgi:hypothetical protein
MFNARRTLRALSWSIVLLLLAGCAAADAKPPETGDAQAAAAVLAQFDQVPIVAFAEQHRRRRCHEFLAALIAHPDFAAKVDDIVVECGNARFQPLVDRYIAGEDVPLAELQHSWRDTGQWLTWDSPLYAQLFARVRARNAGLPPEHRLRVLLGDPPIDWAQVRNADDYRKFAERDEHYAAVVEREVLAKHRRALLIVGAMHLLRKEAERTAHDRPGVAQLLQRHGQPLFVVWTLPAKADAAKLDLRDPEFMVLRGSRLAATNFAELLPPGIMVQVKVGEALEWVPMSAAGWPAAGDVVDGVLHLGGDAATVDADAVLYRSDPQYVAELRRRAAILEAFYGFEFLSGLEALLAPQDARSTGK